MALFIQSCTEQAELKMEGQWRYLNNSSGFIPEPFESFCPKEYPPIHDCYELVYIQGQTIEHPLMSGKEGFSIKDKLIGYEVDGKKITFFKDSLSYQYNWNRTGNIVCFDDQKFCLVKVEEETVPIDSTKFKFEVKQEFSPSYQFWMDYKYSQDSIYCEVFYESNYEGIQLNLSKREVSYVVNLLERIPEKHLDRIYNNGLSDCTVVSIDFYTADGYWRGIETCGLGTENPFEIRALLTNMFWILHDKVRKD